MTRCLAAAVIAVSATTMHSNAEPTGALTPEFLTSLREGYEMDAADRARHNAVTNNDLKDLALDRRVVAGEDGHFSHRIDGKGITNQKSSGRCWMFAGFNVMRPKLIRELKLEEFEFSTAYLQFWDKLEKSNLYLEQVIELRDADPLDREWELINEHMVGDGGWWNFVTGLIEKYGVVPASVMPETQSSENTRTMNAVLERLLRARAVSLVKAHQDGAPIETLRKQKEAALREVYRFLVINLGEPPTEFEWRYKTKDKKGDGDKDTESETGPEQSALSEFRSYTPQKFYKDFVGVDLKQYVCLYHDANQETGEHYRFARARNIAGQQEMHFANVEIDSMKEIAVKSVLANQPMWFAVNMGIDQSTEHGLMEDGLFDYETLFGIDLDVSKADRTRFHAGASNHAMVLMGVDLDQGKPRKWLVENSWGDEKGKKGRWTLYDAWFDEHVYTIIVDRAHVPAEVLAIFDRDPKVLPAWYPGAMGIPGS